MLNKKNLTEADIRTKFITPALVGPDSAKWDLMTQLREEIYFTKGRVIVRGKTVKRGEAKKADYILYYKPGMPIAVIEAKDNNHSVGAGMQQALDYAEILDVPFAYSCNGDAFLEHDRTGVAGAVEREIPLDQFPAPEELWSRYRAAKGLSAAQQAVTTQDYYDYPPVWRAMSRGVPTAYAAPPLNAIIAPSGDPVPVWPSPAGTARGLSLAPLYPSVPQAALRDPKLYALLVLFDAIRSGQARERNAARELLDKYFK